MDMREIRSGNLNFIILKRYNFCQASALNLNGYGSVELSVEL